MFSRRLSPIVIVAFMAAHVMACACRYSSTPAHDSKSKSHGCCKDKAPAPQQKPQPKSCCCSDGSHEAIAEEPSAIVAAPDSTPAVSDLEFDRAGTAVADHFQFRGAPPGRPPDVLLFTLHASLLI